MTSDIDESDVLARRHGFARKKHGSNGLERRDETIRMLDRQEWAVDDRAAECDDAVGRSEHLRTGRSREVGAAMPWAVLVHGRSERHHDAALAAQRPAPARPVGWIGATRCRDNGSEGENDRRNGTGRGEV